MLRKESIKDEKSMECRHLSISRSREESCVAPLLTLSWPREDRRECGVLYDCEDWHNGVEVGCVRSKISLSSKLLLMSVLEIIYLDINR